MLGVYRGVLVGGQLMLLSETEFGHHVLGLQMSLGHRNGLDDAFWDKLFCSVFVQHLARWRPSA